MQSGRRVVGSIERGIGLGDIGRLGGQRGLHLFALIMHQLRNRFVDQRAQPLDGFDGPGPIMLGLVDANKSTHCRYRKARIHDLLKRQFGAVQHARLEILLGIGLLRVLAFGNGQISARQQA